MFFKLTREKVIGRINSLIDELGTYDARIKGHEYDANLQSARESRSPAIMLKSKNGVQFTTGFMKLSPMLATQLERVKPTTLKSAKFCRRSNRQSRISNGF